MQSLRRQEALILDGQSQSDTYTTMEIDLQKVSVGHEASVSKIVRTVVLLIAGGLSEEDEYHNGCLRFYRALVKELPMEYAVEMYRLILILMTEPSVRGNMDQTASFF